MILHDSLGITTISDYSRSSNASKKTISNQKHGSYMVHDVLSFASFIYLFFKYINDRAIIEKSIKILQKRKLNYCKIEIR